MTRQEFIDEVNDWQELIDFCNREGIDYCDDVYDFGSYSSKIEDEIQERLAWDGWEAIRDWLYDLPCGCEYYVNSDNGWFEADNSYFEDTKQDVLNFMDDDDRWDEDEEEEQTEEFVDNDDEDSFFFEEDISLPSLFLSCSDEIRKVEYEKCSASAIEQKQKIMF